MGKAPFLFFRFPLRLFLLEFKFCRHLASEDDGVRQRGVIFGLSLVLFGVGGVVGSLAVVVKDHKGFKFLGIRALHAYNLLKIMDGRDVGFSYMA